MLLSIGGELLKTSLITIAGIEQQQTVIVMTLLEALFSQSEIASCQGDITDLSPLLSRLLLLSDLLSYRYIVESDGEFELMIKIGSDLESKLLLVVVLEELSKLSIETIRDLRQVALSLVDLVVKDADLEVHHIEEKSVGVDVEVLVDEVQTVLFTIISKDVLLLV